MDTDVVVAGAGPAGSAAALALATSGAGVILIEGGRYRRPRLGETLAPAAHPVLVRLGLSDTVETCSTPSFGNESAWGDPELQSLAFVFHPHGAGWHLDRPRFDSLLAGAAASAGAQLLLGETVRTCRAGPKGTWRLTVGSGGGRYDITARGMIDATGRRATLARSLGAQRVLHDHLVGLGVEYRGSPAAGGPTTVEAAPEGWWYTAPLPPDRFMVMFMTDSDLCRAGDYITTPAWDTALARTVHTKQRVSGLERVWRRPHPSSAASHRLCRGTGTGRWLATGDAAMAVDPLAGDGILRALVAGEAAGVAMSQWLDGRPEAAHAYERWLDDRFTRYSTHRFDYYGVETRWPAAPFWRRRQQPRA